MTPASKGSWPARGGGFACRPSIQAGLASNQVSAVARPHPNAEADASALEP